MRKEWMGKPVQKEKKKKKKSSFQMLRDITVLTWLTRQNGEVNYTQRAIHSNQRFRTSTNRNGSSKCLYSRVKGVVRSDIQIQSVPTKDF